MDAVVDRLSFMLEFLRFNGVDSRFLAFFLKHDMLLFWNEIPSTVTLKMLPYKNTWAISIASGTKEIFLFTDSSYCLILASKDGQKIAKLNHSFHHIIHHVELFYDDTKFIEQHSIYDGTYPQFAYYSGVQTPYSIEERPVISFDDECRSIKKSDFKSKFFRNEPNSFSSFNFSNDLFEHIDEIFAYLESKSLKQPVMRKRLLDK